MSTSFTHAFTEHTQSPDAKFFLNINIIIIIIVITIDVVVAIVIVVVFMIKTTGNARIVNAY